MDYKKLKLTKKDLEEIKRDVEENRKQRMEFVKMAAKWTKKTPNKVWSKQQKKYT
jgi:hypothetical protein